MATEKKKYTSSLLKTIGYAFFTPLASTLFQWMSFNKSLLSGHILFETVAFCLGWVFIAYGYIMLNDER